MRCKASQEVSGDTHAYSDSQDLAEMEEVCDVDGIRSARTPRSGATSLLVNTMDVISVARDDNYAASADKQEPGRAGQASEHMHVHPKGRNAGTVT